MPGRGMTSSPAKLSFALRAREFSKNEVCAIEAQFRRAQELHDLLNASKNRIGAHFRSQDWDRSKRVTNPYELVFTSSTDFPGMAS